MDPAPDQPRQKGPAPSTEERLVWWFTIYFAGPVGVVIHMTYGFGGNFIHGEGDFTLLPLLFPLALGSLIWFIAPVLPQFMMPVVWILSFFGGFVFYGWHLYATLKADTRRRFDILLVVLVLAVLANQWLWPSILLSQ
jgi:hypothetical protein